MDIHKKKLSKLGQSLANNMRNITKNFRLGFGSFVEKETLPFVNTAPRSLKNPCLSVDKSGIGQCVEPYGYQHHMTLTDNSTLFEAEVNEARVSGNLDSPEGNLIYKRDKENQCKFNFQFIKYFKKAAWMLSCKLLYVK